MTTRRRSPLAALLVMLLLALPVQTASADHAATSVSDVRAPSLSSGGPGLVTYGVTHDIERDTPPFTALPGARLPNGAAFDGLWGQFGEVGAWLAPTAGAFSFQFEPHSTLLDGAYFTNWLRQEDEALPLQQGDRFELAMGNLSWDAVLPTDGERRTTGGQLEWDTAVDTRVVSARYEGAEGQMDALFVRADIVARGGDVDARGRSLSPPPLVIDLPRIYPGQAQGMYIVSTSFPYTHYVSGMTMRVIPGAGKAVLQANVRGYIPEGREVTLPGGRSVKEWHLPLHAVILASSADDPVFQPVASVDVGAGRAVVGDLAGTVREVALDGDGPLTVSPGAIPALRAAGAPGEEDATASEELGEFEAAAEVHPGMAGPRELDLGNGAYRLAVDPDARGEGILALRAVTDGGSGIPYAETIAVPYLILDGLPVKLHRSRLIGLRAFPVTRWVEVGYTGAAAGDPFRKTRTLSGRAVRPGLAVDAAWDLGEDRYALLQATGFAGTTSTPSLSATLTVLSLGLTPVQGRPVYHVEVPPGPVTYGGEDQTESFSAPLDLLGEVETIAIGPRTFGGTTRRTDIEGRVTVLPGPAPFTAQPSAVPARPLDGDTTALLYSIPDTYPAGWSRQTTIRLELSDTGPPPEPSPPPIGAPCGTAQVREEVPPDAPPHLDVTDAWLDADPATIYATIRLRGVPSPPPEGTTSHWSFHWRGGHSGVFARATLSASGSWAFDQGGYNNGFFKTNDVTGEVEGSVIRIAVPRSIHGYPDGSLLRDTGAHSWLEAQGALRAVDTAPNGADPTWGTGDDYRVAACSS